jgi:hypothetical protein
MYSIRGRNTNAIAAGSAAFALVRDDAWWWEVVAAQGGAGCRGRSPQRKIHGFRPFQLLDGAPSTLLRGAPIVRSKRS